MNSSVKVVGVLVLVTALIIALFTAFSSVWEKGQDTGGNQVDRNTRILECAQENPSKTRSECVEELQEEGVLSG